ncbi:ATP-binding cassette domain-containing protein [Spongiibacter taiwanensis]|uniref:ABC transporter ATP-binding protein n=1 Tax=Spongiibacter taiwanensis TaxID=1748242 RepID=UPI002034B05B|nr:oligopeptide/dipeptide ABC transporter ATP-binding protein [Spongiibacter taiwanensis]USA43421.1 ATP-binding cassette domain-containing protein [Spongiibacter taiwanensis]
MSAPLLEVENLKLHFPHKGGMFSPRQWLRAVDGVSFSLQAGETLGLVGESGCGKSSLGKALLNLHRATAGSIRYQGRELVGLSDREMRPLRADLQMIFQDPFESLNSRHPVETLIEEPLVIHGVGNRASRRQRVLALLDMVGLPQSAANKYPHEFSGGQRQRIGIARAIALEPKILICDEPVSALDVSVQAQILNLLVDIQAELGLAMLFISHDLSVVRHMSDRIAVMYLGKLAEVGPATAVYEGPRHPYTKTLLSALPQLGVPPSPVQVAKGDLPSPLAPPSGCRFHTRCPHRQPTCAEAEPALESAPADSHSAACHYWEILAQQDGP